MDELSRIPAVGELHPRSSCLYCGATTGLRESVCRMTLARGLFCVDIFACLRRVKRSRSRDLLRIRAA